MKKWFCLVLFFPLLFTACAAKPPEKGVYQKISPEEAKQMMDSDAAYILLDVRTEEEFAEGHIAGAILIPDYELAEHAASELPDKSARILLYCRSGRRSANAANLLIELGYTNVYDFGGILDWPYDRE